MPTKIFVSECNIDDNLNTIKQLRGDEAINPRPEKASLCVQVSTHVCDCVQHTNIYFRKTAYGRKESLDWLRLKV